MVVVVGATVRLVVVGTTVMRVVVGTTVISVVAVGTGVGVTVAGLWVAHPIHRILTAINTAKIRKILFFSMTKILHIPAVTGMF
jgi:hypothetical protein